MLMGFIKAMSPKQHKGLRAKKKVSGLTRVFKYGTIDKYGQDGDRVPTMLGLNNHLLRTFGL